MHTISTHTPNIHKTSMFVALFGLLAFCVMGLPLNAKAYESTNQRVLKLDEQHAIFLIDFQFVGAAGDFYLPVKAMRDLPHGSKTDAIGYSLEERGEIKTNGVTTGIVLSDAEIVDGMYRAPENNLRRFTLLVVLRTDTTDPEDDYELQVTDLPFYFDDERTPRMLNVSELVHYRSPEADLNN